MYAPRNFELHPKVLVRIAQNRARHSLAKKHFPWRAASGGISISPNEREGKYYLLPRQGGHRSAYRERLAIMASPIVAVAEDFVDR
jgi:hypothetical protein